MSALKDALQIGRLQMLKRRIAEHWQRGHCHCVACAARRAGTSAEQEIAQRIAAALAIVRRHGSPDEADAQAVAPVSRH